MSAEGSEVTGRWVRTRSGWVRTRSGWMNGVGWQEDGY